MASACYTSCCCSGSVAVDGPATPGNPPKRHAPEYSRDARRYNGFLAPQEVRNSSGIGGSLPAASLSRHSHSLPLPWPGTSVVLPKSCNEKGDRYILCEAPFGPLRQNVPIPFFAANIFNATLGFVGKPVAEVARLWQSKRTPPNSGEFGYMRTAYVRFPTKPSATANPTWVS